jgi:hypothetical protein
MALAAVRDIQAVAVVLGSTRVPQLISPWHQDAYMARRIQSSRLGFSIQGTDTGATIMEALLDLATDISTRDRGRTFARNIAISDERATSVVAESLVASESHQRISTHNPVGSSLRALSQAACA